MFVPTIFVNVMLLTISIAEPSWLQERSFPRTPFNYSFRFANVYGDEMVLQQAPARAMVWGFCHDPSCHDTVTITFQGKQYEATRKNWGGNNTWVVILPPTPSSFTPYNITASSSAGSSAILVNVLFGDVWVCSGQSNMAFGIGGVNDSKTEIADEINFPFIRMYTVGHRGISTPQIEATSFHKWGQPQTFAGGFSAVCWFYGRDIYEKLTPKRPIGLIDTNVGGTPVEHWSSPDALKLCFPKGHNDSLLWNGMVVPLLNCSIRGTIWYQGENNNGNPTSYNCTFPTMIDDWRSKWYQSTSGNTDPTFPFGFAQLDSTGNGPTYNHPKDRGDYAGGFAGLRWSQTAGYGYVPNPRMPKTFMAVILDTPNSGGGVHSPFKQPVGSRLARSGLSVAYNMKVDTVGPRVQDIHMQDNKIIITITNLGAGAGLELKNKTGFEVLGADGFWYNTPITAHSKNSVTISAIPSNATKVRYLWYNNPCGLSCYECAVYTSTQPLGTLSGQLDFLPLAPFIHQLYL